jgi:hypothetical protein
MYKGNGRRDKIEGKIQQCWGQKLGAGGELDGGTDYMGNWAILLRFQQQPHFTMFWPSMGALNTYLCFAGA